MRGLSDFPRGMVWLVGAGPGDPELLTRKAERLIRAADVILYDALVSDDVLAMAMPGTQLVSVGKRSGRHSKVQGDIDQLIVASAQRGLRVVRLKGGDPAIFARAAEELAACRAAGIAVAICPGITAASAAAASLGTSLTLRGFARRLTLITAHVRDGLIDGVDWDSLAEPDATLAIYMGKSAATLVSRQLIVAGMAPDTPAAVVENASLPNERIVLTRLDLLPIAVAGRVTDGPAVLLIGAAIGEACSVSEVTQWATGGASAMHLNQYG